MKSPATLRQTGRWTVASLFASGVVLATLGWLGGAKAAQEPVDEFSTASRVATTESGTETAAAATAPPTTTRTPNVAPTQDGKSSTSSFLIGLLSGAVGGALVTKSVDVFLAKRKRSGDLEDQRFEFRKGQVAKAQDAATSVRDSALELLQQRLQQGTYDASGLTEGTRQLLAAVPELKTRAAAAGSALGRDERVTSAISLVADSATALLVTLGPAGTVDEVQGAYLALSQHVAHLDDELTQLLSERAGRE